jgi:hypothetical protein
MIKYHVVWSNTSETKSGCITVYAKSIMGAIANARETLQMGSNFRVVRVYEGR